MAADRLRQYRDRRSYNSVSVLGDTFGRLLYYKCMRFKTLCLSLLLLVGINLGVQLFVATAPIANAAIIGLEAFPSRELVQEQRKFTYESLNIRGTATLTIYTVQCNSPNECATVETRGIAERWVIAPGQGGTDNELVFTPTNEAGTAEDVH